MDQLGLPNQHGSVGGEAINAELKQHAAAVDDWHYQELATILHEWADRFRCQCMRLV